MVVVALVASDGEAGVAADDAIASMRTVRVEVVAVVVAGAATSGGVNRLCPKLLRRDGRCYAEVLGL